MPTPLVAPVPGVLESAAGSAGAPVRP